MQCDVKRADDKAATPALPTVINLIKEHLQVRQSSSNRIHMLWLLYSPSLPKYSPIHLTIARLWTTKITISLGRAGSPTTPFFAAAYVLGHIQVVNVDHRNACSRWVIPLNTALPIFPPTIPCSSTVYSWINNFCAHSQLLPAWRHLESAEGVIFRLLPEREWVFLRRSIVQLFYSTYRDMICKDKSYKSRLALYN
ncbi:uncharacterized protein BT62DRAFT_1006692 [Guyanagaster necrorhizus]|uniref:Uncharacterized protein n=1 Tax=Guyanagaster necrorhizus TaxID=856835 RepID=A0A9P7VS22_9AGAR|nr:uncharacterized protein BT62DRAFT_1006692 [Guyanagaster necrorhizus MCA 3950]KAG7445660.1 hypothetical protein BT62DRAFT_1006692 [Guyanagaster necrorhizus MCA 3950]